jgi:uncharacterized membrane protein (Fun14 family)
MSGVLPPLSYQLGIGGLGGFIIGYATKKISKLIVVLSGLFLIFLLYLGTNGIIAIDYEQLWRTLSGLLGFAGKAAIWLIGLISLLPFAGGFLAGFFLGFKSG